MQRIAIVDPNEASRESLRALLLGVDFVWLEAECTRYEYFFDVIQQSMPELAIVSLDGDKPRALQMIGQLSVEHPQLPILTISHDHQALLQSLQKGAKYFLTHPVGLEDLLAALRRAVGESGPPSAVGAAPGQDAVPRPAGNCQIVAVLGTRGGIGTTTLAVNLGACLAADPNHTAALVDLDLSLGDADIALEVNQADAISIADLARNIERLDMNYLRRAMVRYEDGGLAILRHPIEIQDVGLIHEAHVERVLNLLKISNTHLVLDLSKSLLPTDLMALRLADTILLVAQLELSSLRNVVRMTHYLGLEESLAAKVKVVLNRVGAESGDEGIGLRKAEEVIGRPIFWQVPYDPKPVTAARVAGAPLLRHGPKSRAHQSIAGLAKAVCGKPTTVKTTTSATTESRKSGWALFGRR